MNRWDKPVDVICYDSLTTFPTRRIARDFFYRGMCETDGAERERYMALFVNLEHTDKPMVHDGEPWEKPCIRGVSKFEGDHIGNSQKLEKPMLYSDYVRQQNSKESVLDKIQEAKALSPREQKPKSQENPEPEL